MDIIYYDSEEFEKGLCSDAFVMKNMKPIPAGTSIFSMPDTEKNRKWKSFADKYDIHFIFENDIPEVDFYSVPQFHIMATDSNGGLIGIIGGKDSLNTHLPIGYITHDRDCFLIASSGYSFLENIDCWKQLRKPYEALKLFDSKDMAKKEVTFLDFEQVKSEMEKIKTQLQEQKQEKKGQEVSSCPCLLKYIFNRNDKSEHTTHLDNVVRIIITCHAVPL